MRSHLKSSWPTRNISQYDSQLGTGIPSHSHFEYVNLKRTQRHMLYNTIAIKSIHKRSGIQSTNNTINKKKKRRTKRRRRRWRRSSRKSISKENERTIVVREKTACYCWTFVYSSEGDTYKWCCIPFYLPTRMCLRMVDRLLDVCTHHYPILSLTDGVN